MLVRQEELSNNKFQTMATTGIENSKAKQAFRIDSLLSICFFYSQSYGDKSRAISLLPSFLPSFLLVEMGTKREGERERILALTISL